jgi:hypothetical protein
MTQSSVSDCTEYKSVCSLFAENDEEFNKFRQNPIYNIILEHVCMEHGQAYLYFINKHMKDFALFRDKFQTSDNIGGPKLYDYGEDGIWSPCTLRYVKVLAEIEKYFGKLSGFNIAEIGAGYGGQCKIIQDKNLIFNYTTFDLPEVNNLTKKFLNNFDSISHYSYTNPEPHEYDLVISNYAFSELTWVLQEKYINNILDKSTRGYITYNNISKPYNIDSMLPHEFKALVKSYGGFIVEEFPLTHEDNFIGIWGV